MRQLWWSLIALIASVALGVWVLSVAGVLDLGGAVAAQLRRLPGVADYITAYQKGVNLEKSQAAARQEMAAREKALEERARQLDAMAKELDKRKLELDARQQVLDQREAQLTAREQSLTGAADRERYYRELVEAVAQMRPEQAAPVIEQLDLELARRLLGSMEPRQAGAILGKLDPKVASRILEAVSQLSPTTQAGRR
ncbi:MAG: hypothetical protein IMX02_04220 [Limnochordaceae bacterium]|nr:hypothetical protein [Limnochordaceae bacterium]